MSANEIELATPTHSDLAHEDSFKDGAFEQETKDNAVPIMSSDHISTPVASPTADAPEEPKIDEAPATEEPTAPTAEPNASTAADSTQQDTLVSTDVTMEKDGDLFGDTEEKQDALVDNVEASKTADVEMPDVPQPPSSDSPTQESTSENTTQVNGNASAPVDSTLVEPSTSIPEVEPETIKAEAMEQQQDTKITSELKVENQAVSETSQKHSRPVTPAPEESPAKRIKSETHEEFIIPADDPRNPPADSTEPMPKHQAKFALASLRSVKRLRDAGPFLAPVDIVKLNIPSYPDFVKQPMDLGTMEKKITNNEYKSVSEFAADMDLIVLNSELFNGPTSEFSAMARNIRASFQKHLKKMPPYEQATAPPVKSKRKSLPVTSTPKSQRIAASAAAAAATPKPSPAAAKKKATPPPTAARRESAVDGRPKREIHPPRSKDLPYDVKPRRRKGDAELKFCGTVLKELMSKKHETYSYPFLLPVDPVAMNIPHYLSVVKEPMDLSTISKKYNENGYSNADEFEADIRLMFRNCYAFNPEGTHVNMYGHRLEALFDKKWAEKPVPPSTPAYSSDEEDGYDTDDHLEIASNPAIKFLETQLERMTRELAKLKKEALKESRERKLKGRQRKKSVAKKPADGRRKSSGGPGRKSSLSSLTAAEHISFDMKKELSEAISTLDESKLETVVSMIRDSMPGVAADPEGEIELDIDSMPAETVSRLYNYVIHDDPNGPPAANGANAEGWSTKGKKSKPLSEAEQSRQIEEIQKKIQQFDRVESGGTGIDVSSEDEDDNENDDDSGSSSEEE